jgi:hypothetical protein
VLLVAGIQSVSYEQDSFGGFAAWSPLFEEERLPDGTIRFATSRNKRNLFICYTGHNEFLEHRTYRDIPATPELVRNTGSLLSPTRVYSTLHRLDDTMATNGSGTPSNATMISSDIEAILDQTVSLQSYERNNRFQAQVLAHFEESLNRIVDIAGTDVIFVAPRQI